MNYPKLVGWILLIVGIVIIGWTLLSSYNIFTAKAVLPEFFEVPKKEVVTKKEGGQDIQAQGEEDKSSSSPFATAREIEQMIGEQLKGVLPADSITKLLNLVVRSTLAFILIFGGSQISSLGIKLIKNRASEGSEG